MSAPTTKFNERGEGDNKNYQANYRVDVKEVPPTFHISLTKVSFLKCENENCLLLLSEDENQLIDFTTRYTVDRCLMKMIDSVDVSPRLTRIELTLKYNVC